MKKIEDRYLLLAGLIVLAVVCFVLLGVLVVKDPPDQTRKQTWGEIQEVRVLELRKQAGSAAGGAMVGGLAAGTTGAVVGAILGEGSKRTITEQSACMLVVKLPGFDSQVARFDTNGRPLPETQWCALRAKGDKVRVDVVRQANKVYLQITYDTWSVLRGELVPR